LLINKTRSYIKQKKKKENYKTKARATSLDSVNANYYLFLNTEGSAMNQTWNLWLMKLFVAAKIDYSLEPGERLTHRFRHRLAVHLIYDLKVPRFIVKNYLGHRSLSSLDAYDNPPDELLLEYMKKKVINHVEEYDETILFSGIEDIRKELFGDEDEI
jgi:site-specific recombinase XerD